MAHADWLFTGLEKFILPARENIVLIKYLKETKVY